MKTVLVCLFVLVAAQVSAQSLQDCYNNIGVFNDPILDLDAVYDDQFQYCGPAGSFTVYVVIINPYNEQTEQLIQNVGGYEFRIELASWLFATPVLPAGVTNLVNFPDLSCISDLPVAGNQCVLLSINIGAFTQDPSYIHLTPISDAGVQSIPGELAVADRDDELSLSRATPASLDFTEPVFGIFSCWWGSPAEKNFWDDCWVVPTQPTSWGSIKAMYR